jgi:hypothetical protein
MADTIETQLENYHLHEELSQNSVLTVYRGERKADGVAVIIKVIAPLFATAAGGRRGLAGEAMNALAPEPR